MTSRISAALSNKSNMRAFAFLSLLCCMTIFWLGDEINLAHSSISPHESQPRSLSLFGSGSDADIAAQMAQAPQPEFDINAVVDNGPGVGQTPNEEYSYVPWNGIDQAEWCQAPVEDVLPYEDCKWDSFVFEFGVHGGLTNALHFILKGEHITLLYYVVEVVVLIVI